MKKINFLLVCVAVLLVSCSKQPLNLPLIANFSIDKSEIFSGAPVKLSWSVTGATLVQIDNGIGPVSATGTVTVNPTASTTYTLTATNEDGSTTDTVSVQVIITLVSWSQTYTYYDTCEILGTVQNVGTGNIYNVMISWQAYNASNTIIDTASGFPAGLGTILSGASASFEAVFFSLFNWALVDHLTYTISWLNGSGIMVTETHRIDL